MQAGLGTQCAAHGSQESGMTKEKVRFDSDGLELAGDLYKPEDFDSSKRYGAVVVAGSFASVKEQMSGTYARKLAERGLVALALDYRNWGESEGQPRQYENSPLKRVDLSSAVTYLLSLPYVRSVSALGVCASGGAVGDLAARDERLSVVAFVAPMLANPEVLSAGLGEAPEALEANIQAAAAAREHYENTGEAARITVYSSTDPTAFYTGECDYYENPSRGNVPEFTNETVVMSLENILRFHPYDSAPLISIPAIVFASDLCVTAEVTKSFYEELKGPKELAWGVDPHFDYYDKPDLVNQVTEKASDFFKAHLP
ncbi:alpha/beta hydrolase [Nocardia sp. NPDC088792]|uniref:alpha/beta hydrolase n=1 Tax=Nocardia sp. NPDC088792 TaxID=3364332 RepID=UPI0037F41F4F